MQASISIQRRHFVRAQYGIVTMLLLLSTGYYLYEDFFGADSIALILEVFDVSRENSLPTWFSSFNLLVSSALLLFIFVDREGHSMAGRKYWLALFILFVALSIDEVAGIHERSRGLHRLLGELVPEASPMFPLWEYNRWVFYGAIFSVLVFFVFAPFLMILPKRTAALFLLAGFIFVGGAVGMEFVGTWMISAEIAQKEDLIYKFRRILEEGAEMYGIVILNCALLDEFIGRKGFLRITLISSESNSTRPDP